MRTNYDYWFVFISFSLSSSSSSPLHSLFSSSFIELILIVTNSISGWLCSYDDDDDDDVQDLEQKRESFSGRHKQQEEKLILLQMLLSSKKFYVAQNENGSCLTTSWTWHDMYDMKNGRDFITKFKFPPRSKDHKLNKKRFYEQKNLCELRIKSNKSYQHSMKSRLSLHFLSDFTL